ncbi:MAG TPA: 30S ribosomal protein S2 [Capillimicrobium sp.]|jgi:small subunit ribosomal protein S2
MADQIGIRELLEAGVHFGHQTRRWNPKMRRFIHGERDGIYIIDLLKTQALLESAQQFAAGIANRGGTVLFVGTKKSARDAIKETAEGAGMPYVNQRWLGGLLTNFQTISLRIKRLHDLERYEREGQLALLPTRERLSAEADLAKLRANLGGVKHMQRPPDAMFVVDLKTEEIAVKEAQRLRIPIIGLVDTNVDPDGIQYVVPGNDDAIKSCALITGGIGSVVSEGHQRFRAEEEKARKEAEERQRREQEERARKEAEERARKEAEERARQEQLVQGGEGMPRQDAENAVAEAVAAGGRPNPDPVVRQKADSTKAKTSRKKVGTETDTIPAPAAEAGEKLTNADIAADEAVAAAPTEAAQPAPTPADGTASAPDPEPGPPAQPTATSGGGDEPKTADSVGVVEPDAPITPNENADENASEEASK